MTNLWPPQLNYPLSDPETCNTFNLHWLWSHEYDKHGKDYSNILQVLFPQKFSKATDKELQVQYFSDVLKFYNFKFKGLQKIRLSPRDHFSKKTNQGRDYLLKKEDIAALLKIPVSHFMTLCDTDTKDILTEVRPCWRYSK